MAAPADTTARFVTLRRELGEQFLKNGRVSAYLKCHTTIIDRYVAECAQKAGLTDACAVVAVGGYGRAEMFPFSDIDVLVLMPEGHDAATDLATEHFVTELWNLRLTVGSVVRTPREMREEAKGDISVATAFLEARFLFGNRALFDEVNSAFLKELDARAFFRSKMLEMRQRHLRSEDSPYTLEPNIKESPGGLRDLQVFLWCAKAAGWGANWRQLAAAGLITETESYHLGQCQHFLNALRIRLHLLANRHEDRLVFDVQTQLAVSAGYKDTAGLSASEELMKRYYLNAKNTVQLNAVLLQAISDKLFDRGEMKAVAIDSVFTARGIYLDIVSEDAFYGDPRNILKAFYVYAQHRELRAMSTRLLRALWHSRYKIDAAFRNDPENKALFISILKLHYGPYHCLKNMNTWGILGRFLPVFRRIVGQMQHDLFHAYTVDQHTLLVVKNLRRFAHSSYAHEFPLCSQAVSELPEPWRLTVAGLFHDIAKGRGGNHSELGAKEAESFGVSFGLRPEDTDFIVFLVREHLTMSHTAQKEDISDPEVVQRFAALVKTPDRLNALFALTVADIRATGPKVWNAWKEQLLEDLYRSTMRVLSGEARDSSRATVFARRRDEACRLVDAEGIPAFVRDAFWKELNIVYFLRHSPEDIAWHAKELAWAPSLPYPVVRSRVAQNGAGIEVLVYVKDQESLFARVVSYFEQQGLSVLDARIHTTAHGWALDTFLVQDRRNRSDIDFFVSQLQVSLAKVIADAKPLPEPKTGKLSRRGRNFPAPPYVSIERDESNHGWILQIAGNDRLGLLFAIAVVLSRNGVSLATAKIATLGERVEDVFLINGRVLENEEALIRIENELIDALNNAK